MNKDQLIENLKEFFQHLNLLREKISAISGDNVYRNDIKQMVTKVS